MTKRIRIGKGSMMVEGGSPMHRAYEAGIIHGLRLALRMTYAGKPDKIFGQWTVGEKYGAALVASRIRVAIKRRTKRGRG